MPGKANVPKNRALQINSPKVKPATLIALHSMNLSTRSSKFFFSPKMDSTSTWEKMNQ